MRIGNDRRWEREARHHICDAANEIVRALKRFETHRHPIGHFVEIPLNVRTNGVSWSGYTSNGMPVLKSDAFFNNVRFATFTLQAEGHLRDEVLILELWPAIIRTGYPWLDTMVLLFVNEVCMGIMKEEPFSTRDDLLYFRGNYIHATTHITMHTSSYLASLGHMCDVFEDDMTDLLPTVMSPSEFYVHRK
jgi:hypothetical protein